MNNLMYAIEWMNHWIDVVLGASLMDGGWSMLFLITVYDKILNVLGVLSGTLLIVCACG